MSDDWVDYMQALFDLRNKTALAHGLVENYNEEVRRLKEAEAKLNAVRHSGEHFAVLEERDLLSRIDEIKRSHASTTADGG